MLQSGILLAIGSAVFCGWADICASQGAKRLGTAKATFLALSMGTLALALFGVLAFARLGLTPQSLVWSIPPGICVGALTALGYSCGYRGMSLGPLAVVSPIVASDGAIAGVLAILLLHERVDRWQVATLAAIFVGAVLTSASVQDFARLLQRADRKTLSWRGGCWGALAALSFGAMLFALGVGSRSWGWYLSMLWSRFFAAAVVLAVIIGHRWFRQGRLPPWDNGSGSKGERRFRLLIGPILALGGGLCETIGLVLFSIGTQVAASTSIVAMIASTFILIPLLFGVLCLGERPDPSQWIGVGLVILGLALLGIKPV